MMAKILFSLSVIVIIICHIRLWLGSKSFGLIASKLHFLINVIQHFDTQTHRETRTSSRLCDRTKTLQVTSTILNSHGMRFTFEMTWTKWVHKQQTRTRSQSTMSQSICHSRWVTIILWLDINRNGVYVNKTNDRVLHSTQTNKDLTTIFR